MNGLQIMSPEIERCSPESGDFKVTELTLGLPGSPRTTSDGGQKSGTKRGFLETVDLNLGNSMMNKKAEEYLIKDISSITKSEVVGWPPLRKTRKVATATATATATVTVRKYVKVAVEGAAYLRKVDLETYNCYERLLAALINMFPGLIICKAMKLKQTGVQEYVLTYQDKDGDWLLVGDVPWKMFVESCKRLRLMKSVDALGLVPKTSPNFVSAY